MIAGPRPGHEVVGAGGVRLHTLVVGATDAPVVVLQHGVGSSRTFLAEAVAPPLVELGWQVALAPVRGHAGADVAREPADHALELLAEDAAALVEAHEALACGGVSIGAHAAVAAAARRLVDPAVRVVAALPAWTGRSTPGEGAHAAVADEVREVGVAGMWARLAADGGLRPWLRRVLLRDLVAHDEPSLAAALVSLDGAVAPTLAELARLASPLAVVGWDDDPGHPLEVADRWAATAPGARLATLAIDDLDDDLQALGRAVGAVLGGP